MKLLQRFGEAPVWVAGASPLAGRVFDSLRRAGRRVRAVALTELTDLKSGACRTLVLADPPEPESLVAGLIHRLGSSRGRGRRPAPLRLILMVQADPPPPLPELDPAGPITLETFAIEDRAARVLLERWPLHCGLDPCFDQRPHLLVVGFAPPARALVVQALRLMPYGEERPAITIIGTDPAIQARFAGAYPQAGQVADLRWIAADLGGPAALPPVTQVLVCAAASAAGPDDAIALAQWFAGRLAADQGVSPPILLEVGDAIPDGSLADWDGQTFPFSYLDEACRPQVLLDGRGDALAQTIHEHYTDSIAAQGRDPEREPAGRPWPALTASYRDANRHQADHIWAKLAVMDCRAVHEERGGSFAFAPLEAERLAVIEHLRWAADRHLDGWSYAPVRDNARKHHPQLIPYRDLSEPMKDLDRFAVRGVPTLLARSELGVVRMLILGIPEPHTALPADAVAAGLQRLAEQVLDRLAARYPDRTLVFAATLAEPGARLITRLALDRAAAGLFLLCPQPIAHTLAAQPDDAARRELLELMARAERRISLPAPGELTRWFARRADIQLVVGSGPLENAGAKRVLLDPVERRVDWNFDY
ncbi:RyR domain-containing protein [Lamprocystis purpurea]|jgi:hypothetical protein|uniref:RyR domain-containing protein n=1 Tax=Lamprocystis purpurea TaxID=61598 RepID=UPI0003633887|nr:RyR domain-containing protein [Lamprocystis purpurea]